MIRVAILGATGAVGQRFVQLLDGHPWFTVTALTGSERTAGRTYGEACAWMLPAPMPAWARDMTIRPTAAGSDAVICFSGLPTDQAREYEPRLAQDGHVVVSNASAHRMWPDVPLLIPEVNADHTGLIATQRGGRGWSGAIVTNPNCTATGLTIALRPILDRFGITRVSVFSMQALSGAGYPGVASLDVLDNVLPYIGNEEEKVETEPQKMLGRCHDGAVEPAAFRTTAHTNRVPVSDGHTVCASVELGRRATPDEVARILADFQPPAIVRGLPSAPEVAIEVRTEPDRPQPRRDRDAGKGMTTVVGRIRTDPLFDVKFVVLSHNTIRGAAGGALLNGELLVAQGIV